MSADAVVWVVILAALVVVLGFAAIQVLAAVREMRRLMSRIDGYADLPVLAPVRNGQQNVHRLETALSRIDPLLARAEVAIAQVRRGPVPPEAIVAARRAWTAVAALRRFANR